VDWFFSIVFSYGIEGKGMFPLEFTWAIPTNQRLLQYFNPMKSQSYVFPLFHLYFKGALITVNSFLWVSISKNGRFLQFAICRATTVRHSLLFLLINCLYLFSLSSFPFLPFFFLEMVSILIVMMSLIYC
jgi:hypothetical protein